MTPEDVGGSLVDNSMTLGTAYIGGKLMQWMGEKWIPLNKNEVNAGKGTTNGATQLPNGTWVDTEGLSLPFPPSISANGRVPKVLQSGGNTLNQSTANALNKYFDQNIYLREWDRALVSLKKDNNIRNNHHGRILDNGDYINSNGNVIGNIGDYLK